MVTTIGTKIIMGDVMKTPALFLDVVTTGFVVVFVVVDVVSEGFVVDAVDVEVGFTVVVDPLVVAVLVVTGMLLVADVVPVVVLYAVVVFVVGVLIVVELKVNVVGEDGLALVEVEDDEIDVASLESTKGSLEST